MRLIISFFMFGFFVFIAALGFVHHSCATEALPPEALMAQGLEFYQRGDFEEARLRWIEAERLFEKLAKINEQSDALTKLSQLYLSAGLYQQALESIETALVLAEKTGNQTRVASATGALGNVYIAMGRLDEAHEHLSGGLAIARELANVSLSAVILNNLGNLLTSMNRHREAFQSYMESASLADRSGNQSLAVTAFANAAVASLKNGQPNESKELFDKALNKSRGLANSHDKAFGLIKIGQGYYDLCPHLSGERDPLLVLAFNALNQAANVAEDINDLRAVSYAWGYLGKVYEDERRYEEALQLTRRAAYAAQQVNAPESLYQWQWQTGRLLKVLGKIEEAISAYRHALDTLQSIRHEMYSGYGKQQYSFRETLGPLYFELIDLLLIKADSIQKPELIAGYLLEARERVEMLKVVELQDYFQDECVNISEHRVASLDTISKTAVVIYPIILRDRTELLVSLPGGLKRFSIPVSKDSLTKEVREFRNGLVDQRSRKYLPHARKLYDWLIRPLEPDLANFPVDALVFVPDGSLRTVPMAALHDGKNFLIKKYPLAITPGLNLTDPRAIQRQDIKLFALGLTESSQGFPPLPYVAEELEAIHDLYGGKMLMDKDFLLSDVEQTLLEEPFNIIHIASHGQFKNDADKTFLLTYDDKLSLERLDQCIGYFRFRKETLELLTLSACETAVGDERAALGLAGVAVKAGARSAVATLWNIYDRATVVLVSEFYRQLRDPSVTRAVALQRAQLKLLGDPAFEHPVFWSPFLLINNWL